mmetsp:Transcript_37387/g.99581  ORF Transcript_37387/g.99581 Transcript_37387/m.99581 type:complete len:206 (-) Transcript_37387:976-1593(-)
MALSNDAYRSTVLRQPSRLASSRTSARSSGSDATSLASATASRESASTPSATSCSPDQLLPRKVQQQRGGHVEPRAQLGKLYRRALKGCRAGGPLPERCQRRHAIPADKKGAAPEAARQAPVPRDRPKCEQHPGRLAVYLRLRIVLAHVQGRIDLAEERLRVAVVPHVDPPLLRQAACPYHGPPAVHAGVHRQDQHAPPLVVRRR